MQKLFSIILVSGLLMGGSCKSNKKMAKDAAASTTTPNTPVTPTPANATNTVAQAEKKVMYRLVVSFYSIGAGTNGAAIEKLNKFVAAHPKKPAFEQTRWGREGETDYCFKLQEFSSNEQAVFIDEVRKSLGNAELVRINENIEVIKK